MTHFREMLGLALHSTWAGRLRTVLTMLGIVLSISLVIAMHGLNSGMRNTLRAWYRLWDQLAHWPGGVDVEKEAHVPPKPNRGRLTQSLYPFKSNAHATCV